ncbi:MAG: glycosyltransferase family 4 protein [Candidatus Eremiobacteraeota bacterium]|nr:glycosyltransferase family 4 protein [Candidatus Eremiobacteraeota bacterium]
MPVPLRLAVDARVVAEDTRGIGRYARAILRRLARRDDVDLTLLAFGPFAFARRRAYVRALDSSRFSVRSHVPRDCAAVWHPANGTFFRSRRPSIVTIHDAVPFRYPDPDTKRRAHAQQPFLRSVTTASRVIAVSAFGRSEIEGVFGVPGDRIDVIHHGVEPSFAPGAASPLPPRVVPGRYVLFVGDPIGEPRKNFFLLYEAFRRAFASSDATLSLVVAGPRAPSLPGVVHAGNLGEDLATRGDERLRALYRGAIVLALASYHETFGMPLLEAMACGTPAIASEASSLPEVGGDAALYAPPDDASAWADALVRVAGDAALRDRLRIAGLGRATHFSWDSSAEAHVAVFRRAASSEG